MSKSQDSTDSRKHDDSQGDAGEVSKPADSASDKPPPREVGGRDGPDPTRYGDWEKAGRCIDF